jgi:hypothetical protein
LLREDLPLLLVLPLRLSHLPKLHAGKPVGNVVQRHHLGMSGLRRPERLRQPVKAARRRWHMRAGTLADNRWKKALQALKPPSAKAVNSAAETD